MLGELGRGPDNFTRRHDRRLLKKQHRGGISQINPEHSYRDRPNRHRTITKWATTANVLPTECMIIQMAGLRL